MRLQLISNILSQLHLVFLPFQFFPLKLIELFLPLKVRNQRLWLHHASCQWLAFWAVFAVFLLFELLVLALEENGRDWLFLDARGVNLASVLRVGVLELKLLGLWQSWGVVVEVDRLGLLNFGCLRKVCTYDWVLHFSSPDCWKVSCWNISFYCDNVSKR